MNVISKVAVAAFSIGWAAVAQAAPITGSLAFADGANETGASLLTRTSFTVTNATTQGGGGDFSNVALNLPVTIGTFTIPGGDAPTATVSPSNFTASFSGGTFLATSAQKRDQTVTATGNESITIYFLGTFTPSGALGGFDPNEASVIANLNRSGNGQSFSVSSAFSLAAPPSGSNPVGVPEPASMALLGIGLVGLGALRRRAA